MIKTHEENRLVLDLRRELARADFEANHFKLLCQQLRKELDDLKAAQMDNEMLKILIMLCHPDKHSHNSPAAEKAIKYLLKLRKR